jgi:hypothetical protein
MEATVVSSLALIQVSPRRYAVVRLSGDSWFAWGDGNGNPLKVPCQTGEQVFGPDLYMACQQYIADHSR